MAKYGNKKTVRNGITFDSQKEAARYDALMLLLAAGEIKDLRLQPEFTLQEAFTTPQGERVRAVRYRADFSYKRRVKEGVDTRWEGVDTRWERVVEDVKGFRTKDYELKRKLMLGLGVTVTEL